MLEICNFPLPGLDPGIHDLESGTAERVKAWMAGSSPAKAQ
jgi:hypothetical protein